MNVESNRYRLIYQYTIVNHSLTVHTKRQTVGKQVRQLRQILYTTTTAAGPRALRRKLTLDTHGFHKVTPTLLQQLYIITHIHVN